MQRCSLVLLLSRARRTSSSCCTVRADLYASKRRKDLEPFRFGFVLWTRMARAPSAFARERSLLDGTLSCRAHRGGAFSWPLVVSVDGPGAGGAGFGAGAGDGASAAEENLALLALCRRDMAMATACRAPARMCAGETKIFCKHTGLIGST